MSLRPSTVVDQWTMFETLGYEEKSDLMLKTWNVILISSVSIFLLTALPAIIRERKRKIAIESRGEHYKPEKFVPNTVGFSILIIVCLIGCVIMLMGLAYKREARLQAENSSALSLSDEIGQP